jgi:Outer membrane protein transport protein (OMPP1/FadL/TodX).
MKRLLYISIMIFMGCAYIQAQTVFDAAKAADSDLNGSARYSSMAGAFGALGGDVSAIKDNPAGLGVFRKSEISITANQLFQNSKSIWDSDTVKTNRNKFGLNNFSLVFASPSSYKTSGLVSSNFSFTYNKLKNFNRDVFIRNDEIFTSAIDYYMAKAPVNITDNDISFNNDNWSWLSVLAYKGFLINPIYNAQGNNIVDWYPVLGDNEYVLPDYWLREKGAINEYAFTWAGNINNNLFLGASLNIRSLDYHLISEYNEDFTGGGGMTMCNYVDITGGGVSANFGLIYLPANFLRLGASIQTPTIYSLSVTNFARLHYDSYDYDYEEPVSGTVEPSDRRGNSIDNEVNSSFYSPLQINGSIAFLFGKQGLLSAEYNFKNYTGMYFADKDRGSSSYTVENDQINTMLNNTSTFKIGGEYKINQNFAVRAGYAYTSAAHNDNAEKISYSNTVRTDVEYLINNGSRYLTTGLGYRDAFWYIDLAFTNQRLDETFYTFNPNELRNVSVTPASVITNFNNLILTVGFRF